MQLATTGDHRFTFDPPRVVVQRRWLSMPRLLSLFPVSILTTGASKHCPSVGRIIRLGLLPIASLVRQKRRAKRMITSTEVGTTRVPRLCPFHVLRGGLTLSTFQMLPTHWRLCALRLSRPLGLLQTQLRRVLLGLDVILAWKVLRSDLEHREEA